MEQEQVKVKKRHLVEDETTPAHEARKRAARNYNEKVPVLKDWYEWQNPGSHDVRKGRKLLHKSLTKNGVTSTFVGWERSTPVDFLNKITKEGKLV